MSIQLEEKFRCSLSIKDREMEFYRTEFSSENQLKEFVILYGKSTKEWSWFKGACKLQRRASFTHFIKDLSFPTFFHFALKINHFVLKMFASLLFILFDLSTLLMRLATLPFLFLQNPKEKHPLILFLEKKKIQRIPQKLFLHYNLDTTELKSNPIQSKVKGVVVVFLDGEPGKKTIVNGEKEIKEFKIGKNGYELIASKKEESKFNKLFI